MSSLSPSALFIFTSGCFCVLDAVFVFFCFGSSRFYARRCFVHLDMHSHCRCVPALRGRSFWDVQDARRTPKNTAVMLVALCCSSVAHTGVEKRCVFLVSSRSFVLSSLNTSGVPCHVSRSEREVYLVFFCSWSGHDVCAGQVFGDRPAGVLRRPRAKQPSLGVSVTEGSRRWRRHVCCLFSWCMWRSGQRQVHNSVSSLCDVRFTSVLWLNNLVRQRCTKPVTLRGVTVTT